MSTSLGHYPDIVTTYDSKQKAYELLGVNQCIRSHKAMVVCTRPYFAILRCSLESAGCNWQGALVFQPSGKAELRSHTIQATKDHNMDITALRGEIGWKSLEQKQLVKKKLTEHAAVRPRAALRSLLVDDDVDERLKDLALPQVQQLKKVTFASESHTRHDLGDVSAAVAKFLSVPRTEHKGFVLPFPLSDAAALCRKTCPMSLSWLRPPV